MVPFHNLDLFRREAVEFVDQVVDLAVGGVDLALEQVFFPRPLLSIFRVGAMHPAQAHGREQRKFPDASPLRMVTFLNLDFFRGEAVEFVDQCVDLTVSTEILWS